MCTTNLVEKILLAILGTNHSKNYQIPNLSSSESILYLLHQRFYTEDITMCYMKLGQLLNV